MSDAKGKRPTNRTCFVVGPIGRPGSDTRKQADFLLNGIIREVLAKPPFDYEIQRADSVSEPGMISDQVITAVGEADLVVADLSEHNPNAFYELAIRHMEEKPVIHMISDGYDIPFDIKDYRLIQFNVADWNRIEQARDTLKMQAEAIERDDYVVSNPITKARGRKDLKETGDSRDVIIADLVEKVIRLDRRIAEIEDLPPPLEDIERTLREHESRDFLHRKVTGGKPPLPSSAAATGILGSIRSDIRRAIREVEAEATRDRGSAEDPPNDK